SITYNSADAAHTSSAVLDALVNSCAKTACLRPYTAPHSMVRGHVRHGAASGCAADERAARSTTSCRDLCTEAVGVMVTLSQPHNPEHDNGVKTGGAQWRHAAGLAEACGRRSSRLQSAPALMKPMTNSWLWLSSWACSQLRRLHYIVRCTNNPAYGRPSLSGYAEKLPALLPTGREKVAKGRRGARSRSRVPRGTFRQSCKSAASGEPGACSSSRGAALGVRFDDDAMLIDNYFYCRLRGQSPNVGRRQAGGPARRLPDRADPSARLNLNTGLCRPPTPTPGVHPLPRRNSWAWRWLACQPAVKHLHKRAKTSTSGVYFECQTVTALCVQRPGSIGYILAAGEKVEAARELRLVMDLINETVGDASLCAAGSGARAGRGGLGRGRVNACYTDLPSRQLKVSVANRVGVTTTDAETALRAAGGTAAAVIDDLVAATQRGRAFVRPSGTEDVVRVYAEGATTGAGGTKLACSGGEQVHRLAAGSVPAAPSIAFHRVINLQLPLLLASLTVLILICLACLSARIFAMVLKLYFALSPNGDEQHF
uniref:PGM_PMM_IV domain-containing protein n=1 Tax=Macrostomum lignano TaxID=282301 RepID=A0A1I8FA22_9PLAT